MMRRPHEDYDVIVHYFRQRGTDGPGYDTWTISHGREKQGERDSLEAATELACDLAAVYSRPAWLLDETGYPLKPIERRGSELDAARLPQTACGTVAGTENHELNRKSMR